MAGVVIIGGGPAGLAAALFAARRGFAVTVVERDAAPGGGVDSLDTWSRRGVPHARQGHIFLAKCTQVLEEEAADIVAELLRRGAVRAPLGVDGAANLLSRRVLYERVFHHIVERERRVTILSGRRVSALLTDGAHHGIPTVSGIRTNAEELDATVVVDASGRHSNAQRWLREIGAAPLSECAQGSGFFYVTRPYCLRPNQSFPRTDIPIVAPLDYATFLAFPGDNDRFHLSLSVCVDDPVRRRLLDPEVFERVLENIPMARPWLERGRAVGEPEPMGRIENRRRRVVRDGRPAATGFVLLGDAACQTNPTTGRGISLALLQAQQLARMLESAARRPIDFVRDFQAWTDEHLGIWYSSQVAIDRVRLQQVIATIRGQPLAPAVDSANRLTAALAGLREDPAVRAATVRLYNLLITPKELFEDVNVMRRVVRYLRQQSAAPSGCYGPDRRAFERMASA